MTVSARIEEGLPFDSTIGTSQGAGATEHVSSFSVPRQRPRTAPAISASPKRGQPGTRRNLGVVEAELLERLIALLTRRMHTISSGPGKGSNSVFSISSGSARARSCTRRLNSARTALSGMERDRSVLHRQMRRRRRDAAQENLGAMWKGSAVSKVRAFHPSVVLLAQVAQSRSTLPRLSGCSTAP